MSRPENAFAQTERDAREAEARVVDRIDVVERMGDAHDAPAPTSARMMSAVLRASFEPARVHLLVESARFQHDDATRGIRAA